MDDGKIKVGCEMLHMRRLWGMRRQAQVAMLRAGVPSAIRTTSTNAVAAVLNGVAYDKRKEPRWSGSGSWVNMPPRGNGKASGEGVGCAGAWWKIYMRNDLDLFW